MSERTQMFLSDRKLAPENLGRVLVLGLGVSGKAASEYLLDLLGSRVDQLVVAAGASSEVACEWAQGAQARGAQVYFDSEEVEGSFDLCIASPGISEFSCFYRNALNASTEVISEVEFAWRESAQDSRWVAITGTNGKTTTTALTEHVLRTAGLKAAAVGNIGDACIKAAAKGDTQVYVAEVSSYQLASTKDFAPHAAVVLNITPDHLHWHHSHENYAAAKWKVLANLNTVPGSVAVLDATDDEVRAKVREIKAISREERGFAYVPLGTAKGLKYDMRKACGSENAAFVNEDSVLHVACEGVEADLVPTADLQIKGAHNISNALAAATVALALGADAQMVSEGLRTFAPLEHRIEPAGEVAGVACYNDTKATNVDAVLKALVAFEPQKPIILLGGEDKGTELETLVAACRKEASAVVCFGQAQERFLEAFGGVADARASLPVYRAAHMEDALDKALSIAKPGDIVLLSPACASFDEFSCYQERGSVFKALVAQRAKCAEESAE